MGCKVIYNRETLVQMIIQVDGSLTSWMVTMHINKGNCQWMQHPNIDEVWLDKWVAHRAGNHTYIWVRLYRLQLSPVLAKGLVSMDTRFLQYLYCTCTVNRYTDMLSGHCNISNG